MQWFLLSYALYCSAAYVNCYHWWPIPIWQPAKYASCNQVLNFLHFTYFCFRDVHAIIIADPTFDLLPPVKGRLHSTSVQLPVTSHTETVICQNGGQKQVCTADVSCQRQSTKKWDTDVGQLMSSEQWLKIYGLKTAKLDMNHLLRQIGFRHSDGKYLSTYLCSSDTACELSVLKTIRRSSFTARSTHQNELRWPEFLRQRSCCVEQSSCRFAITGHLAGHLQTEIEDVSLQYSPLTAHLLPRRICAL